MLTNRLIIQLCLVALSYSAIAQTKVQWLTWEEAIALNEDEPRKFFVDVYTDWCGWCKKMDKATFQNEEIATYLNKYFYAIKFNAEQKAEIEIKDEVYKYVKSGQKGYHEYASKITFGRLSFPTIVFLDENLDVIQPIAGYKDPIIFEKIMTYFGEDHHKTTPWKKYSDSYHSDN